MQLMATRPEGASPMKLQSKTRHPETSWLPYRRCCVVNRRHCGLFKFDIELILRPMTMMSVGHWIWPDTLRSGICCYICIPGGTPRNVVSTLL